MNDMLTINEEQDVQIKQEKKSKKTTLKDILLEIIMLLLVPGYLSYLTVKSINWPGAILLFSLFAFIYYLMAIKILVEFFNIPIYEHLEARSIIDVLAIVAGIIWILSVFVVPLIQL